MVSIIMMNIGFIITLRSEPEQCFNEITPNDMYSSAACAWSGAFVICGGVCAVSWVLVRALSMHLQICWDVTPGRKFFYLSQLFGWMVPGAVFVAAITASGVSFRFGPSACHINHDNSLADYWIWMLVSSGVTVVLQLATVGYCTNVYLRNLWASEDEPSTQASEGRAPAYASSYNAQGIRAVWKRMQRVLWLQWRGLFLVSLTLSCVVFFSVVFVYLDDNTDITAGNEDKVRPFLTCLIATKGKADECYAYGQSWLVNEAVLGAVLILLTCIGVSVFPLLFRFSFLTGWVDRIKGIFTHKQEFVSLDAMNPTMNQWHSGDQLDQHNHQQIYANGPKGATFEMQTPPLQYKKDYGDAEDATTITTASYGQSPSNSWSPHTNAQHWGRQTPEMVYQQPYSSRGASPDDGYYADHTIGQAVAHPHPNIARAQQSSMATRRTHSPQPGYGAPYSSDWNSTGLYNRPFSPEDEPSHYPMGNAFAQQRR